MNELVGFVFDSFLNVDDSLAMIGNNIKQREFIEGESKEYLKYLKFEASEYKKSLSVFCGGGIGSKDRASLLLNFKKRILDCFARLS